MLLLLIAFCLQNKKHKCSIKEEELAVFLNNLVASVPHKYFQKANKFKEKYKNALFLVYCVQCNTLLGNVRFLLAVVVSYKTLRGAGLGKGKKYCRSIESN